MLINKSLKLILLLAFFVIGFSLFSANDVHSLDLVSSYDTMGMIDNIEVSDVSFGSLPSLGIENSYSLSDTDDNDDNVNNFDKAMKQQSLRCKRLLISCLSIGIPGAVCYIVGVGLILSNTFNALDTLSSGEYDEKYGNKLLKAGIICAGVGGVLVAISSILLTVKLSSCKEPIYIKVKSDDDNNDSDPPNSGEFVLGVNNSGGLSVGYKF